MIAQEAGVAGEGAASSPARLSALLQTIREVAPPPGDVLSVVLDLSPARWERDAHMLTFRDGCKAIRPHVPEADRKDFERGVARAERFLTAMAPPTHPGIALYVAADPGYFFATMLPDRPRESVTWSARPELEPLQRALDDSERVAVALVDQAHARIFTVAMGEIEARQAFSDDVPRKQATGGWYGLAQTRFERHRETRVMWHIRRTIDALMALSRQYPFDRLLSGGPDEAVALLEHHLPRPLRLRLSGRLRLAHFASDAEILQATLEAAERIERNEELAAVRELLRADATPHAALGLEPVLAAVSENRVHRLFLAESHEITASVCSSCERLTAEKERCPVCSSPLPASTNVREALLDRAWRQNARVDIVSGEAATALEPFGGLGSWVRH